MSSSVINLVCLVLSVCAFGLNLAANSSDHWWISRHEQEFQNVGLWQICFNHYRHRFDFYGKIYTGCWWIFSPETRMLFSWISTTWFQVVQAFATLSMLFMLLALILMLLLTFSKNLGQISSRFILVTATVMLSSGKNIVFIP